MFQMYVSNIIIFDCFSALITILANEWFELPDDYSYSQEFWGELYYKLYGDMTAEQARSQ